MPEPERLAYLDIDVDEVMAVTCSVSADPTEPIQRQFYMRGSVSVYAGEYHRNHDAVAGRRAAVQVFTRAVLPPSDLFWTSDSVEHSAGAVTIEAGFAPVEHDNGDGEIYEAPPANGWLGVTATQFDALLSTLATNRVSGYAPRLRLRLAGDRLPGTSSVFVDIRDLVAPERHAYPVVGLELSAIYHSDE